MSVSKSGIGVEMVTFLYFVFSMSEPCGTSMQTSPTSTLCTTPLSCCQNRAGLRRSCCKPLMVSCAKVHVEPNPFIVEWHIISSDTPGEPRQPSPPPTSTSLPVPHTVTLTHNGAKLAIFLPSCPAISLRHIRMLISPGQPCFFLLWIHFVCPPVVRALYSLGKSSITQHCCNFYSHYCPAA